MPSPHRGEPSSVMENQVQHDDDGDRHADQPE